MVLELGEDHGVGVLGLLRGVRVDEEVHIVARNRNVPALEALSEIGAERAQPILEESGELPSRIVVSEFDPHSPVVSHRESIEAG